MRVIEKADTIMAAASNRMDGVAILNDGSSEYRKSESVEQEDSKIASNSATRDRIVSARKRISRKGT